MKAKGPCPWPAAEAVLSIYEAYEDCCMSIRSFQTAMEAIGDSIAPSLAPSMTCLIEIIDPLKAEYHTLVIRPDAAQIVEPTNGSAWMALSRGDADDLSGQELGRVLDAIGRKQQVLPLAGCESMRAGAMPIEISGLRLGAALLVSSRETRCAQGHSLSKSEKRLLQTVVSVVRRALERTIAGPQLEASCARRRELESLIIGRDRDEIDDRTVIKVIVSAALPFTPWEEIEQLAGSIPSATQLHLADVATLPAEIQALVQAFRIVSHRGRWAKLENQTVFENWQDLIEFCCETVGANRHEEAVVIFLDQHNRIIYVKRMFQGTFDQVTVFPREIVKAALSVTATQFILVHNHPDGCLEPSPEDVRLTAEIRETCAPAGIGLTFVDHIIVTRDGYYSFREAEEIDDAKRRTATV